MRTFGSNPRPESGAIQCSTNEMTAREEVDIHRGLAWCCFPVFVMCTQAVVSITLWCQEKQLDPPAQDREQNLASDDSQKGDTIVNVEPKPVSGLSQQGTSKGEPAKDTNEEVLEPGESRISDVTDIRDGSANVK